MNGGASRADPFATVDEDLSDFAPKTRAKPVEKEKIDELAEKSGFVSRQPAKAAPAAKMGIQKAERAPFRYRTGRNHQLNMKVTPEAADELYKLSDELQAPLGEVFERALAALRESLKVESR